MKQLRTYNGEQAAQARIGQVVSDLCDERSYRSVYHRANHDVPMPAIERLSEIVELLRAILFPGYFGNSEVKPETMGYYIGASVDTVYQLLAEQLKRGYCFSCAETETLDCADCERRARDIAVRFIERLPEVRHLLSTDVAAAFEGDPAAKSSGEAIFSYPSIVALTNFRIAHELYRLDVPLIPRIITEMAHSRTGIDLHPGAEIGERFFIDHGTGVVIGETSVIGRNVRLYQGVTLGAKSFPMDDKGNPIKGIPRHPIVEDDVIIYSGATVLGRVTIGRGAVIGGNVWLTRDVPPGGRIMQGAPDENGFSGGGGI
ncbi:MAG TPA: serine acetyltransferase [Spirochaetota bacterium]|nr:serine acetyltransferase [Spirochaetota bacterium]HNT12939.1 serine acetyltransferase [Spirochaetota bacterium]HPU87376.1 serine acetyltransferase [Spirochaetota bacterium]